MFLHRRDAMLRLGQAGLGMFTLPTLLEAQHNQPLPAPGKAKSCILVYLWGGPPQQDMFDLKPEAPEGIRGLFQPIDTAVPGIQLCDQLPLMARHTDKMAIIRSYTHSSNVHEPSVHYTLTGKFDPQLTLPRNMRKRTDFPNVGSTVAYFKPPGNLPGTVTIPRPIGHDGVIYAGTYAGFLGPQYDPMELKPPGEVNAPPPHSLDLPDELTTTRLQARFGLLNLLEAYDRVVQNGSNTPGLDKFRQQAYRMLTSPEAKRAFNLDQEPPHVRDRYGRNEYGENFLLARRLIEAGVRLVTIAWVYITPKGDVSNVWDNHGGIGALGGISGYDMLKADYCLPPLDRGYSALLDDLQQRGLLDETLVAMFGEFGRTPKINAQAGRDHWGPCQSVVLAGGGVRGGQIYGASDAHAAYPTRDPVRPEDFLATIYWALGISPQSIIYDRANRPHRIVEGEPITAVF